MRASSMLFLLSAPLKGRAFLVGAGFPSFGARRALSRTVTKAAASGGDHVPKPVPHLGFGELTYTPSNKASIGVSKKESWTGDLMVVTAFQQEADKDKDIEAGAVLSDSAKSSVDDEELLTLSLIKMDDFKGAAGSSVNTLTPSSKSARRLAVVGLGKESGEKDKAGSAEAATSLGKQLAALAGTTKAKTMGVVLPDGISENDLSACVQEFMDALYKDVRYKGDDKPDVQLEKLDLLNVEGIVDGRVKGIVDAARCASDGVALCKDLVNAPPNFLTPATLADTARKLAEEYECLEVTILSEAECRELGMGAYLGVAQGGVVPPEFIHLTYKPPAGGEANKKVALVGKGVTFDSGGYNIKAGAGSMIELMKFDMGGAGAVLGTAKAVAAAAPPGVEAHFIIAACENMVSDKAMRPGDVLTASNGKTIEIINTDAEGRLTLADALIYAEKLEVDAIVDCATLTGACLVALGKQYAAVYSANEGLSGDMQTAATRTGEKIWSMPLAKEYKEELKSMIADYKNCGSRYGGSITAALFLQEFVTDKTPWMHVDLAGPVWNDKSGATGYGVKMFAEWVGKQGKKED